MAVKRYWAGQISDDVAKRAQVVFASDVAALESQLAAVTAELQKIAFRVETHWKGAGLPLEASWIISAYNALTNDVDNFEQQIEDLTKERDKALAEVTRLRELINNIRAKLAEYLERVLQGRALPNRWVGEINDIVGAALSPASAAPAGAEGGERG